MNNQIFGEIVLYTKDLKSSILQYEWNEFKKYAEKNLEYLKVTYSNSVCELKEKGGYGVDVILFLHNNKVIKFNDLISDKNLTDFVLDNGYINYTTLEISDHV